MRYLILTIAIQLLLISTSFAQSSVDKKNGFRHYKMGSDISQYLKELQFTRTGINEHTKHYKVKEEIQVVGHAASIDLVFIKKKLSGINVRFENIGTGDYDELLRAMENIYGKATNLTYDPNKPADLEGHLLNGWNGKLVGIQFDLDTTSDEATITFWNFENVKNNYDTEF